VTLNGRQNSGPYLVYYGEGPYFADTQAKYG